jgi:transposase InsO family protein
MFGDMVDTFSHLSGRVIMSWKAVTVMEQRQELVRLAMLEGANRRELFRRFGVSAQTGYKWIGRAGSGGDFADRSRKPLNSPLRCPDSVEQAVLAVRDQHPAWGARKIGNVLKRQRGWQAGFEMPVESTIHAILVRHGRIAAKDGGAALHLRFERPEPNELWQMDFKGASALGNGRRLHPLTVIDDHSRYALCIGACADETGTTVKARLEQVFRHYGLPQAFFVDNGNPWGDSHGGKWTKFRVWLLKLGVHLIFSRPLHPQSRGKIERFHRSMDDEVFSMRPLAAMREAQHAFNGWRGIYNHERPHEGIAMQRPAERYRPSPRSMPQTLPQVEYGQGETVRKVTRNTHSIWFNNRKWNVPKAFDGESLAIRPHSADGQHGIHFGAHLIKTIDLTS